MTQPPIIEPRRLSPSGPLLPVAPPPPSGCVLQTCADYERSDVIKLQQPQPNGRFLLPRVQLVDDDPLRCEFVEWTAGSFLKVEASAAFNLRASAAPIPVGQVGNHKIAVDVGAGWQVASRTGRGLSFYEAATEGITIQSMTVAHATVLGPFDVAPKVAIAALWAMAAGAHLATGKDAASAQQVPNAVGLSLVCSELAAACVVAAQPPEFDAEALVDPRFAP